MGCACLPHHDPHWPRLTAFLVYHFSRGPTDRLGLICLYCLYCMQLGDLLAPVVSLLEPCSSYATTTATETQAIIADAMNPAGLEVMALYGLSYSVPQQNLNRLWKQLVSGDMPTPVMQDVLAALPKPWLCGSSVIFAFQIKDAPIKAVHALCSPEPYVRQGNTSTEYAGAMYDEVTVVGWPLLCDCEDPPLLAQIGIVGKGLALDPPQSSFLFTGPVPGVIRSALGPHANYSSAISLRNLQSTYVLPVDKYADVIPVDDRVVEDGSELWTQLQLNFPLASEDSLTLFQAVATNSTLQVKHIASWVINCMLITWQD